MPRSSVRLRQGAAWAGDFAGRVFLSSHANMDSRPACLTVWKRVSLRGRDRRAVRAVYYKKKTCFTRSPSGSGRGFDTSSQKPGGSGTTDSDHHDSRSCDTVISCYFILFFLVPSFMLTQSPRCCGASVSWRQGAGLVQAWPGASTRLTSIRFPDHFV